VVAADPQFALGWVAIADAERTRYTRGDAPFPATIAAAQAAIDRALAIDPDLIDALITKSYLLTVQWRAADALGVSRRAIELAPNDARVISTRANVLGYLGRPRDALALRQRAAALDPLAPGPVFSMHVDYMTMGLHDEARDMLERALRMTRSDAGWDESPAARVELAFGKIADSIDIATRAASSTAPRNLQMYEELSLARAWSLLGAHDEADRVLARVDRELPEAPVYLDAWLTVRWARGDIEGARQWIEHQGRHAAQDPWQHAASAQARALAGDTTGALADYALALDAPADRDLVTSTWFPSRFGMAPLANWIALRKTLGLPYAAELDDYERRLDEAVAGGTALPLMYYHRAALAALRDDPAAAERLLAAALDHGWVDPLAFDVDLTWRAYAQEAWLARQRGAQTARIASERARLKQLQSGAGNPSRAQ